MVLEIKSTEPEAVRSEVDKIVDGYNLAVANYEKKREESTPAPQEGNLEDVFEIDITSIIRVLGHNLSKLIARGIVQDHYNGDWSKVRFVGLGEELPLNPRLQLSEELEAV